jgi:hypothetical protein
MAVAYQSVSSSGWSVGLTSVVSKPSGLAVGDLMIGWCALAQPASVTPPSGFTSWDFQLDGASDVASYLSYKTADSSDVAASNFTFTSNNSVTQQAHLIRISGQTIQPTIYKYGEGSASNSATPSIAAGVTPDRANSLLLMFWSSSTATSGNSTYAIATSNPTWTEIVDSDDGGTRHMACAYATRPEVTATGNISVSGGGATTDWAGQLIAIAPAWTFTCADNVGVTEAKTVNLSILVRENIGLTEDVSAETQRLWTTGNKSSTTWDTGDKS